MNFPYPNQGTSQPPAKFNSEPLNSILGNSMYLAVEQDSASARHDAKIIQLRHELLAVAQESPDNVAHYKTLAKRLGRLTQDSVWSLDDREKIVELIAANWREQLFPKLVEIAVSSIKFHLKEITPTEFRIDLGFCLEKSAKSSFSMDDFLKAVSSLVQKSNVEVNRQAPAILKRAMLEYQNLEALFRE